MIGRLPGDSGEQSALNYGPENTENNMTHTPQSAARAVRALLERTSRIAKTWPEYWQEYKYRQSLAPADRPSGGEWANAYQAYRLTVEQVHGPNAVLNAEQSRAIQEAIQEAMPELFAEYWDGLREEVQS